MRTLQITAPARLDVALTAAFPTLGGGRLHKYLRENKIKVNGKKLPLNTRLVPGDTVCLYVLDDVLIPPSGPLFLQARRAIFPIYEDENVLVTSKPAGLLVMDETGKTSDTLLNRALLYLYENGAWHTEDAFTPCLCHRIDTGTSGLVILAKNAAAEQCICSMIKSREIVKKYLCVVLGTPQPPAADLHAYLKKDAVRGIVSVTPHAGAGAKEIHTRYETLATNGELSLLSVELITGRTHQIRAHMAYIGCPILGDSKYGDNAANRAYNMKYQALCAHMLTFPEVVSAPCEALRGLTLTARQP